MTQQVIPPRQSVTRLYQGPRQEKQFRKKQRQLQQEELQNVYLDKQEQSQNTNADLNTLSVPLSYERSLPATIPVISPVMEAEVVQPAKPKQTKNIQLVILAYALGVVGIFINGWFAYSRGSTPVDKALLCGLGFISEAIAFYLPAQTSTLWRDRNIGGFIFGCLVCVALFVFAIFNSLGFASVNLHETATARAERITPAVSDAQRRLDALSASRASECLKRGDKCRQLEKEEQLALEALRDARRDVSATADPQVMSAAKLVSWVSLGRYNPTQDDFAMLRLLLLTLLPQLGGLVLMVSRS